MSEQRPPTIDPVAAARWHAMVSDESPWLHEEVARGTAAELRELFAARAKEPGGVRGEIALDLGDEPQLSAGSGLPDMAVPERIRAVYKIGVNEFRDQRILQLQIEYCEQEA